MHAGAEELGRVYAADLLCSRSMACAAPALATLAPPSRRPLGRVDRARRTPTTRPTSCRRRVEPLDMAEVVRDLAAARSRRRDLHQRRRQLQRLAAPLLPLPGLRTRSHAARADVRRDGLRPAGRGRGAARCSRERTVVNIAGDGDFLMTGQELATAIALWRGSGVHHRIVVDNGIYGTIRMHQEREYPGRVIGTDLGNPDFAALARAYGWRASERVDATAGIRAGVPRRAGGGPPDADPSARSTPT